MRRWLQWDIRPGFVEQGLIERNGASCQTQRLRRHMSHRRRQHQSWSGGVSVIRTGPSLWLRKVKLIKTALTENDCLGRASRGRWGGTSGPPVVGEPRVVAPALQADVLLFAIRAHGAAFGTVEELAPGRPLNTKRKEPLPLLLWNAIARRRSLLLP